MEYLGLAGLMFIAWAGFRLGAMSQDEERITSWVKGQGGRLLAISWAPLAPGWMAQGHNRTYAVSYVDRDENEHWAICSTSLFGGRLLDRRSDPAGQSIACDPNLRSPAPLLLAPLPTSRPLCYTKCLAFLGFPTPDGLYVCGSLSRHPSRHRRRPGS